MNGDRYEPYYRMHINGELAALFDYEYQAEDYLKKLTQEQAFLYAVKNERTTYRTYMMLFQNVETKRIAFDSFMGKTEAAARKSFKECYPNSNYRLLLVEELQQGKSEEETPGERS